MTIGASRVAALSSYQSLPFPPPAALIIYEFNDGGGIHAADSSGNNNIGVFTESVPESPNWVTSPANGVLFTNTNTDVLRAPNMFQGSTPDEVMIAIRCNATNTGISQRAVAFRLNGMFFIIELYDGSVGNKARMLVASSNGSGWSDYDTSIVTADLSSIMITAKVNNFAHFYVNNVETVAPMPLGIFNNLDASEPYINIGSSRHTSPGLRTSFLNGLVSHFEFWDKVPSTAERTDIFSRMKA